MKQILSHGVKPASQNSFMRMSRMLLLLAILLVTCNALFAYDLYVDLAADPILANGSLTYPYVLIQDAIDHAFDDSLPENQTSPAVVIKIFDATSCYTENLDINYMVSFQTHLVTNLTLMSISDNPEACMITALNSTLPVVQVKGNSTCTLSVRGLTIKHNQMVDQVVNKGILLDIPSGMYGYFDILEVENCIFDNNHISIEVDSGIVTINSLKVAYSIFNLIQSYNTTSRGIVADAGGHYSTSSIIGNEFIRHNPNIHESEAVVLGGKFSSIVLNENQFTYANAYTANNFNLQDVEVCGNRFYESSLTLTNYGTWKIEQNKFVGLSSPGSHSALRLHGGIGDPLTDCSINENIFFGSFLPLEIKFPGDIYIYHTLKVNATLERNSFINCGGILSLQRLSNMQSSSNSVSLFRNNFYNGTNNAPFIVIDHNNNNLTLTGEYCIPVSYSHFSTMLTGVQSLDLDTSSVSYGNPQIVIDNTEHSYSLVWDETIKSPLINRGCPELGGVVQTDPDGTPPDIGAVYYPHQHKTYEFIRTNQPGIFWLSFPVVDDRSFTGTQHWHELGCLFQEHMDNIPNYNQIQTARWSYNPAAGTMSLINGLWNEISYKATQPKGFKLQFREDISQITPVVVNGFKADPATTPVELKQQYASGGTMVDFENWIGYFVPHTLGAGTAFSRALPANPWETYLDYIYSIKTQTWSTKRVDGHLGGAWITDPNQYTLSEGDMVAIKLMRDAPEELYWNSGASPEKPRLRELAQSFSYREKLDYTPVFIEFDPEDLPDEVGLFVRGECRGAAVVDSSLVAVNFYPDSANQIKSGDEIEIMFYYAGKGICKAPAPLIYNPQTLLFEAGSLKTSALGEYGYISFNRHVGSSLVPLITELRQNHPNPFRAETRIAWTMGKDSMVSIGIYNLKGQKVRSLYQGMGSKGLQSLLWDARDDHGQRVASGVYFCRLNTPDTTKVQKMLLLK